MKFNLLLKRVTMRRSARIAALYGTEWSNRPSLRVQRIQPMKKRVYTWSEQHALPESTHQFNIPTRGICTITDDQLRYDRTKIQRFMNQAELEHKPLDRARAMIPLFEYIYSNPCILFWMPSLMETTVRAISRLTSEISKYESQLQVYFDTAYQMSNALSSSQREIGDEILKIGMKQKVEEQEVWHHIKQTMRELRAILPIADYTR